MASLDYIKKENKKVNGQYTFASHDSVTSALHPYLVKLGVVVAPSVKSLTQEGNRTSVCLTVSFINADQPEDRFEVESWGYGVDPSDKGPGKAVSYAFKYAILKTFCLETGDDPEKNLETKFDPMNKVKPPLTPDLFKKRLIAVVGNGFSFDGVEYYITELSKRMQISEIAVMNQALEPQRNILFANGWADWYNAHPSK